MNSLPSKAAEFDKPTGGARVHRGGQPAQREEQPDEQLAKTTPATVEFALARLYRENATKGRPEIARPRAFALLLALRPEATRVALLTAICASGVNALAAQVPGSSTRALTRFFPSGTSHLMLASARFRRLDPEAELSAALERFNDDLADGIEATLAFAASGWNRQWLTSQDNDGLVVRWRRASGSARRLLFEVDRALSEFTLAGPAPDSDALTRSLLEAEQGGMPLMLADGTFAIPDWAELRRSPRVKVSCRASMVSHGGTVDIVIGDISTGGAGILTPEEVSEGERIVIVVDRSIVLPGRVIWSMGRRAGVALDSPLVDDSPAFRFLAGLSTAP